MIGQWMDAVPAVIFCLIVGGVSDAFSRRKPLLIMPLLGDVLGSLFELINALFLYQLPTEFFYLEHVTALFGGPQVYYLGFFVFGATIANSEGRTARLALYSGIEQVGMLTGILKQQTNLNSKGPPKLMVQERYSPRSSSATSATSPCSSPKW